MKTLIILALLSVTLDSKASAPDEIVVFSGGNLNAAREKAVRENKLLILEFSAKWCLPCRYMEKNVFQNQDVQKFSERHAIIYQIDIDENKNLKEEYNVEVLPTIILMKATGAVLARKEESLTADAFMNWIDKNKNVNPSSEIASTSAQPEEVPVQVEMPNLETKDYEPALTKKYAKIIDNNQTDGSQKSNGIYYHLQAGVFNNKTNAENMLSLLSLNFKEPSKIVEEKNDKGSMYKVCIGNFNNMDEAMVFQQLLEEYHFNAIIRQN